MSHTITPRVPSVDAARIGGPDRVLGEQEGERLRVTVTGIPEETVRAINLDHLDPAEVDRDAWAANPDTLVVPQAGEVLYRLR